MKRVFLILTLLGLLASWPEGAMSQELKPLIPEFHGYATQAFVYSNRNNWNTTNSTGGSFAWTEAVLNANSFPASRLRLGAQMRLFRLGEYRNTISVDWAAAEFKVNEHFGVRAGKVKSPIGMLNETQDIDPAYPWILLPQVIYPVASRNALLAHYGAVAFGSVSLGERLGKAEYRAYVGNRSVPAGDGYFDTLKSSGITAPDGATGRSFGGALRWKTPLRGLMIGSSLSSEKPHANLALGPLKGTLTTSQFSAPFFFAHYERSRITVAGEYRRFPLTAFLRIPPLPLIVSSGDQRSFYVMTTYKLATRLTGGLYYGSEFNLRAPLGNDRYSKDWTVAARYDFNPFVYLKAEQHFIDGTSVGFSASNNTGGLTETSRLSLIKLGVTF